MNYRKFYLAAVSTCLVVVAAIVAAGPARSGDYWGFDTTNLDKSCKPCDDFYQFAMGGWMKTNPIPPEYSTWGSFSRLLDKNQQNLKQILEEAEKAKATPGSNEQRIGDFYASCMDTSAIEAAGRKPIEAELASIALVKTSADLQLQAAKLQKEGVGVSQGFPGHQGRFGSGSGTQNFHSRVVFTRSSRTPAS